MNDFTSVIILIIIVSYFIWAIITIDKRIIKKIQKDAIKQGIKIDNIRDPNLTDGKNPLSKSFNVLSGTDFISASEENKHYKLIEAKDYKYWVRVISILSIPTEIKWSKKIKNSN